MRRGDSRYQVGRAGAGRAETDAHLAGRARVAVGSVGRALLVAYEDVLDTALGLGAI